MTGREARWQRAVEVQRTRMSQAACASDFLRRGDTVGEHAKRCVHGAGDPCSRDYDPYPVREAVPVEKKLYENTGIGTLYGWATVGAWQLAGWNVRRRTRRRRKT